IADKESGDTPARFPRLRFTVLCPLVSSPGRLRRTTCESLPLARDLAQDIEGSESCGMVENLRRHDEFVWPVASDKVVQIMPYRRRRADHGAGENGVQYCPSAVVENCRDVIDRRR